MSAAASASPCLEKEKLLRVFAQAVSDYNRMHTAQLPAVLNGDDFPFEREIADANWRREQAKYAILSHREAHGC